MTRSWTLAIVLLPSLAKLCHGAGRDESHSNYFWQNALDDPHDGDGASFSDPNASPYYSTSNLNPYAMPNLGGYPGHHDLHHHDQQGGFGVPDIPPLLDDFSHGGSSGAYQQQGYPPFEMPHHQHYHQPPLQHDQQQAQQQPHFYDDDQSVYQIPTHHGIDDHQRQVHSDPIEHWPFPSSSPSEPQAMSHLDQSAPSNLHGQDQSAAFNVYDHDPSYLSSYAASLAEYSQQTGLALDPSMVEAPSSQIRAGIPRRRVRRPQPATGSGSALSSTPRRAKTKHKLPTERDVEDEDEGEGMGMEEGANAAYGRVQGIDVPKDEALKGEVRRLWKRKGLWVGMPVRELVNHLTEIKLEVGRDKAHAIGLITGVTIRLQKPGEFYIHEVQDQSRKASKRMRKLNEKFDRERLPLGGTGEERETMLYQYCRFVRNRDEYRLSFQNEYNDPSEQMRIAREAKRTWDALISIPGLFDAPQAQHQDHDHDRQGNDEENQDGIPMLKIEKVSRGLEPLLLPSSREDIADYLRFFMAKELQLSAAQIDVFNKARNEWLKEIHFTQRSLVYQKNV